MSVLRRHLILVKNGFPWTYKLHNLVQLVKSSSTWQIDSRSVSHLDISMVELIALQ